MKTGRCNTQLKVHQTFFCWLCAVFFLLFFAQSLSAEQYWSYNVQPGDTLWKLSKTHLSNIGHWKKIQTLNNITDPNELRPGTIIRFPIELLKPNVSTGKLITFVGDVNIQRHFGLQNVKAFQQMLLWSNDTITVGTASNATILFPDGSKVLIQEDSTVLMQDLKDFGDQSYSNTKIYLKSGRIQNKTNPQKQPGSRFEISTPSAIAAVRGTEFRISADNSGDSRTEVLTGGVSVSGSGSASDIDAGFGTITKPGKQPTAPVKLLMPPTLDEAIGTVEIVPFPVTLQTLPGAVSYRMQVSKSEEFDSLVSDSTSQTTKLLGPDLPNGTYYLRVRGIDENGLEGFDSVHVFKMAAHPIPPILIRPAAGAQLSKSSPTFEWAQPDEAVSYTFQLSSSPDFNTLLLEKENYSTSSLTVSEQLSVGSYFWRVASVDKNLLQGPFNKQEFRVTPPSPDLSNAKMDEDGKVFHWPKSPFAGKYRCQIASDSDFSNVIIEDIVTEPLYNLEEVSSGQYFIRVSVIDADGYQGPFSAAQKFEVPEPPPPLWTYGIPFIFILAALL